MRQTILARRYAKAIFSLAEEGNAVDSYRSMLRTAAEICVGVPEMTDALTNPVYPLDARLKVMIKLGELVNADKIMASFFRLLVEKKRAGLLPEISTEMDRMSDAAQNVSHGTVISAVALDAALQTKIQATLEKITGGKVVLDARVDPSIIGGIITRIGDKVLDGSIRTQLTGLKESIKGRN
ncbi:MAG: F0F1 ATP synthase subunit delta [Desulfobulbaceae bacterium A2]|nr:MAG: F0F1 ATP synthase subunit delta [Desulfobulbaceae bacterium A2]